MAFQKGLFKIIGSLGGLNFYKREGEFLVRVQSKISKKRMLQDPAFARTRENMNEFGEAARLAKTFRQIFAPTVHLLGKTALSGRVTAVMKKVNLAGEGERGQRAFQFKKNRHFLKGFDFYPNSKPSGTFWSKSRLVSNANSGQVSFTIKNFDPFKDLSIPIEATSVQWIIHIGLLSDVVYDVKKKEYKVIYPELHGKSKVKTHILKFDSVTEEDLTLKVAWDSLTHLSEDVALICGLGIQFLTQSGNNYVPLQGSQAFYIVGVL